MIGSDPQFWIVRGGEAKAARETKRGIEYRVLIHARWHWIKLPYNAREPKRYASQHEAAIAADAADAIRRMVRRRGP